MVAKFAVCPYCHERVPLFIYAKHVQVCKRKHMKAEKPKSILERFRRRFRR